MGKNTAERKRRAEAGMVKGSDHRAREAQWVTGKQVGSRPHETLQLMRKILQKLKVHDKPQIQKYTLYL